MATKKFLTKLFNPKTKKSDKENQHDEEDNRHKHVNFRESFRSSLKSRNKVQYNNPVGADDDDSSEVTLTINPPPNPYHVLTDPKRDRGPRSFAGEDLSSGSGLRGTDGIGAHDNSFRSEFIPPRNDAGSVCGGGGRQRRRNFEGPRFRLFSAHSSDDSTFKDIGNGDGGIVASSSRCLKSLRNGRYKNVASNNTEDEKEDKQSWTEQRMHKYEKKCRELAENLSIAINNERTEKARRKQYQKMLAETANELYVQRQVEEKLRRDIHEYQEYTKEVFAELRYYRLLVKDHQLAADSNQNHLLPSSSSYYAQNMAPPMSSTAFNNGIGRQCHNVNHQRHHNLANANQIGIGAAPSTLIGNANRVFPSDIDEALTSAGLSNSSFPNYKQNTSGHDSGIPNSGSIPPPASQVSLDSVATTVGMDGMNTRISPIVFRNPLVSEDTLDEVKVFRNQHTDSFSGSSRPGTIDNLEMNEIKDELTKDLFSGGTSRNTSRSNDISSSPEISRSGGGQAEGAQNSLLVLSFNGNENADVSFIRPDSEADSADTGTLTNRTKDDGYATSETTTEKPCPKQPKNDEKSVKSSVGINARKQPTPRCSSCIL